jgi:hypothetical protein
MEFVVVPLVVSRSLRYPFHKYVAVNTSKKCTTESSMLESLRIAASKAV